MRSLLVFSIAPYYPDKVHGGSQKNLHLILNNLPDDITEVTVICPYRPDLEPFRSGKINVKPILGFKQPFPDPYKAPINVLLSSLDQITQLIKASDIVYSHDSGMFALDRLVKDKPLLQGIRDFSYSESIRGLFEFRRDILVVNSVFSKEIIIDLFAKLKCNISERIYVLPNTTSVSKTKDLRKRVRNDTILWPHRTENGKGLHFFIRSLRLIKNRLHKNQVVITNWNDESSERLSSESYLGNALKYATDIGVREKIKVVSWQTNIQIQDMMKKAAIVICTSNMLEPSNNVFQEAQIHANSVVSININSYLHLSYCKQKTRFVDYGDDRKLAKFIIDLLSIKYLGINPPQLDSYQSTIKKLFTTASILDEIRWDSRVTNYYVLCSWVTVGKEYIYDGFRKRYIFIPKSELHFFNKKSLYSLKEIANLSCIDNYEYYFRPLLCDEVSSFH